MGHRGRRAGSHHARGHGRDALAHDGLGLCATAPALGGRGRSARPAEEAHLGCPAGSGLQINLRGRQGISDDGDLRSPGAFGNLPCGVPIHLDVVVLEPTLTVGNVPVLDAGRFVLE